MAETTAAAVTDNSLLSLSLWDLVRLNCIVCGLELVASAALVYLPPMLLGAGFAEEYMSWVLGCGPFLCLIFVPIMGQWMDSCTSRYGRRMPFMFTLSVLVLISLGLIPYADHMTPQTAAAGESRFSLHAYLLAFGVILMDFSTQAGLTPCEVFLQDVTKGLPLRDRAFALYSLMCSLGSCGGYLILSINWEQTVLGRIFGDQEYCVFFLLSLVFLILMTISLRTAHTVRARQRGSMPHTRSHTDLQLTQSKHRSNNVSTPSRSPRRFTVSNATRLCSMLLPGDASVIFNIPYSLRRLVYANFFSWAGVMCFLLFYTDYVGEVVYGGKPSGALNSKERLSYDEGVRMGSFGLLLHAIMSSFAAPIIERLQCWFGMRRIHTSSMVVFTVCVLLILQTKNLIFINTLAMLTGVAFASMTTIPFSLVGMYHEDKQIYYPDSLTAARGLGADMAILDTSYFCSQVLLLSVMGYLVHLTHSATTYLLTAASLSAAACYFINTAIYSASDIPDIYRSYFINNNNSTEESDSSNVLIVNVEQPDMFEVEYSAKTNIPQSESQ